MTILRQIANAMAADSRLLIVEILLDDPPAQFQVTFDLMMLGGAGKERTLAGFEAIARRAGLRVTQSSRSGGLAGVIECMLA